MLEKMAAYFHTLIIYLDHWETEVAITVEVMVVEAGNESRGDKIS